MKIASRVPPTSVATDRAAVKALEGSMVEIRLADGSALERCEIVSAAPSAGTVWICADGVDAFVPAEEVLAVIPLTPPQ